MADVSSNLYSWSTTAGSNLPAGSTTIGTGMDDNLREIQAVVRAGLAHKGADIASATTTDLGAVAGLMHDITGTTTITSFGTVSAGIWKIIKFEGALTLTHNSTSLILPGAANITTADGDVAIVMSEGSGNWRCLSFCRASGKPVSYDEQDWTPTVTASSGSITTVSAAGSYTRIGRVYNVTITVTITTNGTGAGILNVTLPVTPSKNSMLVGRGVLVSGASMTGTITSGSTTMSVVTYNNAYPGASGETIVLSGQFI